MEKEIAVCRSRFLLRNSVSPLRRFFLAVVSGSSQQRVPGRTSAVPTSDSTFNLSMVRRDLAFPVPAATRAEAVFDVSGGTARQ